jgi:hypothetical protein
MLHKMKKERNEGKCDLWMKSAGMPRVITSRNHQEYGTHELRNTVGFKARWRQIVCASKMLPMTPQW